VVGYDDDHGCWICKNSWGTGWGEGGFFRIAYGQCGIDAQMWAINGIVQNTGNSAAYVSQKVPTQMADDATVEVTMWNNGTTKWTSSGPNPYRLGSQNPQDNTIWGLNRVDVPTDVLSGDLITFRFDISYLRMGHTYNFQWRMVQEGIAWFGDYTPNVVIYMTKPV
jgi:hypothetical protein